MKSLKTKGKPGRMILLVALATGLVIMAATMTGIMDPLSLIASATEPVQQFASHQMDRLDYAICEVLAHIEYACTRGAV